ncbi:D-3-phosphoglycerate dehydrogenase [Parapedobacter composti]|uniref:D-3-phosphoglycerate dehydrogenase n=1 Tax=Parapedobacter composti TaxID=623281 RepID=A0A1I1F2T7_9SPHI|nr:2-hydroxyacid dehydrogenase [Parapedobacter composti]SFB93644.1 D-3-phosphoglycerate dehydrogenase [Parapedobacter composti]
MRILVTAPYHEKGRAELAQLFGEVVYKSWKQHGRGYKPDELITLLADSRADALITEHDEVTAEVIQAYPGLKFIGVCRGTPSNIAVQQATEQGIPVFNTPARNAQAVAELFIANIITFMRHTRESIEWLENGRWGVGAHTSYLQFKGNELAGKQVGMVGFGAVGQTIAQILKAFPCRIGYYDPFYTADDEAYAKLSLEELFRTSDIVGIHLPVTEETKGMIGERLFSLMKPNAVFVNTARAVVVDRMALLDVIENGRIGGAILDVFDHEPPDETDYRLIRHPRVLATPHIAGATHEVEDHHVAIMNRSLKQYFKENNRDVRQWVNKESLTINVTSS